MFAITCEEQPSSKPVQNRFMLSPFVSPVDNFWQSRKSEITRLLGWERLHAVILHWPLTPLPAAV